MGNIGGITSQWVKSELFKCDFRKIGSLGGGKHLNPRFTLQNKINSRHVKIIIPPNYKNL